MRTNLVISLMAVIMMAVCNIYGQELFLSSKKSIFNVEKISSSQSSPHVFIGSEFNRDSLLYAKELAGGLKQNYVAGVRFDNGLYVTGSIAADHKSGSINASLGNDVTGSCDIAYTFNKRTQQRKVAGKFDLNLFYGFGAGLSVASDSTVRGRLSWEYSSQSCREILNMSVDVWSKCDYDRVHGRLVNDKSTTRGQFKLDLLQAIEGTDFFMGVGADCYGGPKSNDDFTGFRLKLARINKTSSCSVELKHRCYDRHNGESYTDTYGVEIKYAFFF